MYWELILIFGKKTGGGDRVHYQSLKSESEKQVKEDKNRERL